MLSPLRRAALLALPLLLSACCSLGPARPAADGLLAHEVFFELSDPSDENVAALIAGCERLRAIPEVLDLVAGARHPEMTREVNQTDYHVGLHVLFEDREGLEAYIVHPVHQELLDRFGSGFASVRVFDYTTGLPATE